MLRMGFFLKFSQRFGMKYLVEIRVQVCSAFVLIKNGTKVHFLKVDGFFWGGREININKKALLKKIETFNIFPTGKLWNGRYKPKCVCDTVEIIPSVLFEISLKFYFQSENCSSLGLSFNCMAAITPIYWFDCMVFFVLFFRQFLCLGGSLSVPSWTNTNNTEVLSCQESDSSEASLNEGKHLVNSLLLIL